MDCLAYISRLRISAKPPGTHNIVHRLELDSSSRATRSDRLLHERRVHLSSLTHALNTRGRCARVTKSCCSFVLSGKSGASKSRTASLMLIAARLGPPELSPKRTEAGSGREGFGKRSKRNVQSSMMSCREGRSPGFFSEKSKEASAGNGAGNDARKADLPA
jgi:hypothetical protein